MRILSREEIEQVVGGDNAPVKDTSLAETKTTTGGWELEVNGQSYSVKNPDPSAK